MVDDVVDKWGRRWIWSPTEIFTLSTINQRDNFKVYGGEDEIKGNEYGNQFNNNKKLPLSIDRNR